MVGSLSIPMATLYMRSIAMANQRCAGLSRRHAWLSWHRNTDIAKVRARTMWLRQTPVTGMC